MILHVLHLKEPALRGPGLGLVNSVSKIWYFTSKTILNFILGIHLLEKFRFDKGSCNIDHAFSNSDGSEQMR